MAKLSILALFAAWAASQGVLATPESSSSVSIPVNWPLAAREDGTASSSSSPSSNSDQMRTNQKNSSTTYTTTTASTTRISVTPTSSLTSSSTTSSTTSPTASPTTSKTSAATFSASVNCSGSSASLTSDGPINSDTLSIGLIGTALGLLIGIVMFVL